MDNFPNGAGFRPEIEDVYPIEDEVKEVFELEDEDDITTMLRGDDSITDDDLLD